MLLLATLVRLGPLELLDRPEQMEPTAPPERPDLLALREPTESMERPDPLAPLVPREPTEQTVQMELTERLGQRVRRVQPEQPVPLLQSWTETWGMVTRLKVITRSSVSLPASTTPPTVLVRSLAT